MTPDQSIAFGLLALAFGLIAGYLCGIPDREKVASEKMNWRKLGYDQGFEHGCKKGEENMRECVRQHTLSRYAGKALDARDAATRRGGNNLHT